MTLPLLQTIPLADAWSMHDGDVGVGWWLVMMVLFWGALVAFVAWMLRSGRGSMLGESLDSQARTPEEILRRRLADGSLSVEEYERRRRVLDERSRETSPVGGSSAAEDDR